MKNFQRTGMLRAKSELLSGELLQFDKQVDDANRSPEFSVAEAIEALRVYESPALTSSDKVMAMQGWNKALAFHDAFAEALLAHWRLLVAADYTRDPREALSLFEVNEDPIAIALHDRLVDLEELIVGLIDGAIRSLCPDEQIVLRESYRPIREKVAIQKMLHQETVLSLECETVQDYLRLFARCGFLPRYWVLFVESFVWTFGTHVLYAKEDDFEDLNKGKQSAYARAVALTVSIPAVQEWKRLKDMAKLESVHAVADMFTRRSEAERFTFGGNFYRYMLLTWPDIQDYFASTNMDALSGHMVQSLSLICHAVEGFGNVNSSFRRIANHLGQVHRKMGVATFNYPIIGKALVDCLNKYWYDDEIKHLKKKGKTITKDEMGQTFMQIYVEVMSLVYYPMLRQEKMINEAREFYKSVKVELNWSEAEFSRRMNHIEQEIESTGRYEQTGAEVEVGCRLAWRNSNKCIGRISWNTLMIRDKRHLTEPKEIFKDLEEHLKIATAGTNIQSVMTVYSPKKQYEALGTRFWNSQLVRYACYKNETTGKLFGDPANLDITEYLIEKKLWTPPEPRGRFDVLPLVLKVPGIELPYVYELPKSVVFEVDIEHPTIPEFKELGYRWCTVPAITNFRVNLGGMVYQNNPFNGWFMSTEIVRNFLERVNVGEEIAQLLGLDIATNPLWRYRVAYELELSILYSFRKNNFTIVDPHGVGESLCVHIRRERELNGRECPGQWSWIGGFVGHTNPTWHIEMRDFLLKPQYGYCCEGLLVHEAILAWAEGPSKVEAATSGDADDKSESSTLTRKLPRVLILYGSETGNAEAAARKLKILLKPLKPYSSTLNDAAGLELIVKRRITHVLCVCSTFGEGGAPTNAANFFNTPIISDIPAHTVYAVLALGSTLYPDFCKAGIDLGKMLSEAGLQPFADLCTVNEVTGPETTINQWLDLMKTTLLPPHLEDKLLQAGQISKEPPVNVFTWLDESISPKLKHEKAQGSMCLSSTELIVGSSDTHSTKKITFEVPAGSTYVSGDHLSVQPLNQKHMVTRFLQCFKTELVKYARQSDRINKESSDEEALEWQAQQCFELSCIEGEDSGPSDVFFAMPTTLLDLLETSVDLSIGGKNSTELVEYLQRRVNDMVVLMNTYCGESSLVLNSMLREEFEELSKSVLSETSVKEESTNRIDAFVARFPNVVVFFEHFRDLFLEPFIVDSNSAPLVSLAEILVRMPRLQPRMYSISSSSKAKETEVSITVGLLKATTSKGVLIEGVCSHYLHGLIPGQDRAMISIRKSSFRLPTKLSSPLIMVGNGTGLAPMMGFLEELNMEKENGADCGPIHLFFGCRTENDFLYKDTIKSYCDSGLVTLHLALSRSKNVPKAYVQDKIAEWGKDACSYLVDSQTHYYVCGDACMADECNEACVKILRNHAKMSRVTAVQHLKKMRVEGRMQSDVWGIMSHFEDSKKTAERNKKAAAKLWLKSFTSEE